MRNVRARAIRKAANELRDKYPNSKCNLYRMLKRHYMKFKNLELPKSEIMRGL